MDGIGDLLPITSPYKLLESTAHWLTTSFNTSALILSWSVTRGFVSFCLKTADRRGLRLSAVFRADPITLFCPPKKVWVNCLWRHVLLISCTFRQTPMLRRRLWSHLWRAKSDLCRRRWNAWRFTDGLVSIEMGREFTKPVHDCLCFLQQFVNVEEVWKQVCTRFQLLLVRSSPKVAVYQRPNVFTSHWRPHFWLLDRFVCGWQRTQTIVVCSTFGFNLVKNILLIQFTTLLLISYNDTSNLILLHKSKIHSVMKVAQSRGERKSMQLSVYEMHIIQ